MSSTRDILHIFEEAGVLLSDLHVVYTSGLHGRSYINKDRLYTNPTIVSQLCSLLVERLPKQPIDCVVGPEKGGIILAQWVAFHLATKQSPAPLALFAEKSEQGFVFRRGYDAFLPNRTVLLVEDILTTGGSMRRTAEAVRAAGGTVAGVVALCNRGGVTAGDLGVPFLEALVDIPLESWEASNCPLCAAGVPITTEVGKGAKPA